MKIVIDVPEEIYDRCREYRLRCGEAEVLEGAVANGMPLPKEHGRLIDADEVLAYMWKTFDEQDLYLPIHFKELVIDEIPTVLNAEVNNEYK